MAVYSTEGPVATLVLVVWTRWGLFYGTERNNGLNHRTERFLKLKLYAASVPTQAIGVRPVSD